MNSLAKELAERQFSETAQEVVMKFALYFDTNYSKAEFFSEKMKLELAALIDSALPKWVEVTPETMPPVNIPVLVQILDNGFPYFDVWKYDDEYPNGYWNGAPNDRVTHWQSLPAAPSTDEKEK